MEVYIVRSKFGQLLGVYTTKEKAEERCYRTGSSYILRVTLDKDCMILDKEGTDDGR